MKNKIRVLLVHGYGVGMENPFSGQHTESKLCGFLGFKKEIESGEAVIFNWSREIKPGKIDFLNPYFHLRVFLDDLATANSINLIDKLINDINRLKPSLIITHSLGGYLLMHALTQKNKIKHLPKKIIFLSTYLSADYNFESIKLPIVIENYHCIWDQALLSAMIYDRIIPAGLGGFRDKTVKNVFYPLKDSINLHTSMIVNKNFTKMILSNI